MFVKTNYLTYRAVTIALLPASYVYNLTDRLLHKTQISHNLSTTS